jgi:aminopeptidase N
MVDGKNEPEFSAIGIVSHELAHQWWGDLITLRSWAHTWLNESFATYSDYLYFRHDRGDDEGALNLQGKLNAYLREAKTRYVRPIVSDRYDQPGDMFDSHSYPKGALVLHMLRQQLGDAAFFDTLKHFLHRYAFEPVDTADFIRSVKTVTGQNLDWFFDQWLFKPGHPVFQVRSDWDPARKVVVVKVAQVQDFARGIPVFRVPVTVDVVNAGGRSSSRVWIREREETFELPSDTRPLLVRFDPENVLLKEISFPKERDELLYQLRHDDVIGRMGAAAELAVLGPDPVVVSGLVLSAQGDPFWAVRRSAVEAVAKAAGAQAAAVLKKAALDAHPSVRAAALVGLGGLKDQALLEFFKERFAKDPSDAVRAESLRSIGKLGDRAALPFLEQAAAVPSYRNLIAAAAKQAVAGLGAK